MERQDKLRRLADIARNYRRMSINLVKIRCQYCEVQFGEIYGDWVIEGLPLDDIGLYSLFLDCVGKTMWDEKHREFLDGMLSSKTAVDLAKNIWGFGEHLFKLLLAMGV